jgi:hypothetical protein
MQIPFGASAPDLPASEGAPMQLNVLPARDHYRPVADLSAYSSNGLSARCQGSVAFLDNSGNVNQFAGDATKLYRLAPSITSSAAWDDVSGATYTTPSDGRISFAGYGNQIVATNFSDPVQLYTIGSSTDFAALSATAPQARYAAIAKNFLFLASTFDGSDGNVPFRIWWSKQGDVTSWPTPGTDAAIAALSDKRDLAGDTGWIQGLAPGLAGADLAIVTERGFFRGTFVGGDQIWSFDLVEGARGTPAPGSLVVMGGNLFYLGEDGFYRSNGITSEPIGASLVDKFFFSDTTHGLDVANAFRISALADPINKVVMWAYPSVSSSGGSLDRVICYNWEVGKWSLITGLAALDVMVQIRALGYTADNADALGTVDTFPFPPDSRQLTGGRLLIGAFNASDHILYTFTGSNLAATLYTIEVGHPTGQRFDPQQVWPLIEGTSVTITVTPITRNRLNDAQVTGSAVAQNATGFCPMRLNARFHQAKIDLAAAGTWTKAIGIRVPDNRIALKGER